MQLIGIDYGAKRIGIAVTDLSGTFALPFAVYDNNKKTLEMLRKLCESRKAEAIVLGESKNFKGEENPIMKEIRRFEKEITQIIKIPVYYEPEYMTSKEAGRIQGENSMHDASAAALILKSFIDKSVKTP